jgi:putative ABC transport system permease protein
MLLKLAWKSLLSRKVTVFLTILSISASTFVLFSVDNLRHQAKSSFTRSVSGVDLIVGPRTGQLNLLLYSVFRIGNPTNSMSWESYLDIDNNPNVSWAIPIALGDSHKGYRVIGTSTSYFEYFKYGNKQPLILDEGVAFSSEDQVVLGANIAKELGYTLNTEIVLSHGVGNTSFKKHDQHTFNVVGILAPTGTPIDQTVHVSLEGLAEAHNENSHVEREHDQPTAISAVFLGLTSRIASLRLIQNVNQYKSEALIAILPGVALSELWKIVGSLETLLTIIGWLVLGSSLVGLCTMLLSSMQQRVKELAILRAIGFGPMFIAVLIIVEAIAMTLLSLVLGFALLVLTIWASQDYVLEHYGIYLQASALSTINFALVFLVLMSSLVVSMIPAVAAYKTSLQRGLS